MVRSLMSPVVLALIFCSHFLGNVPVIGLGLAVRPFITRRVGVALPVFRHGTSVSCNGPPADRQRAILSWKGQTQTGQIAVAPLEGLDAFQAVRATRRLLVGPVQPVFRLRNANAAVCQAVHLCGIVSLLFHTDGRGAQWPLSCVLTITFRITDRLG